MLPNNLDKKKLETFFALQTVMPHLSVNPLSHNSLGQSDRDYLKSLSDEYALLNETEKTIFQKKGITLLRNRGRVKCLDVRVHFEHLAEFIKHQPKAIKLLILKNLTPEQSGQIIEFLGLQKVSFPMPVNPIYQKLSQLVKNHFLSKFACFEKITEPNKFDQLSPEKLARLVFQLGAIEVAIACQSLNSIENFATLARQIGTATVDTVIAIMSKVGGIQPYRMNFAEAIVREVFIQKFPANQIIHFVGLKVLAFILAKEEQARIDYAKLRMPLIWAEKLDLFLDAERTAETSVDQNELVFRLKLKQDLLSEANRFLAQI